MRNGSLSCEARGRNIFRIILVAGRFRFLTFQCLQTPALLDHIIRSLWTIFNTAERNMNVALRSTPQMNGNRLSLQMGL